MGTEATDAAPGRVTESRAAIAAALVTVVLWGSAFVGIRAAGRDLSAGPLTLGRLLVATLILSAFVLYRKAPLPPRADVPRLLAYGVIWFGLYNIALNASEQRIGAGTAAMIISFGPIILAVLAGLLLREGFPRSLLIGGGIAFSGAFLIGLVTSGQSSTAAIGIALCFGAAVAYACGVILQKPLLNNTSALTVTWLGCVVGVVVCLPFAPQFVSELAVADVETITWMVYLGALPTAVAFTTWAYALARSTAGRMGAMTYLVAPFAVLIGWLVLGEVPPWLAIVGGVLCLGGVIVAQRKK